MFWSFYLGSWKINFWLWFDGFPLISICFVFHISSKRFYNSGTFVSVLSTEQVGSSIATLTGWPIIIMLWFKKKKKEAFGPPLDLCGEFETTSNLCENVSRGSKGRLGLGGSRPSRLLRLCCERSVKPYSWIVERTLILDEIQHNFLNTGRTYEVKPKVGPARPSPLRTSQRVVGRLCNRLLSWLSVSVASFYLISVRSKPDLLI